MSNCCDVRTDTNSHQSSDNKIALRVEITLTFKRHSDGFETENELNGIGQRTRLGKAEPGGAPEKRQKSKGKDESDEISTPTTGEADDGGTDKAGNERVSGVGAAEEEEEEDAERGRRVASKSWVGDAPEEETAEQRNE